MPSGERVASVRIKASQVAIENKCEKNNDLVGQAILSVNLGIVWFEKGNTEAALTCIDTGLSLAQKLGNKQLTSIALGCIGNIWLLKGNFEKTEYYLIQDLNIVEELGDRQGIAIASELMGKLYHAKGLFEEALPYFEVSLSLCRALNYQKGIAKALIGMGDIYVMQKDYREALECFEKATEIALKISNTQLLTYAHDEKEKTLQLLTN